MQALIPVGVAYTQFLDDVRALIRHELTHAPAPPASSPTAAPADELLSIREAAALLGVSVQTVHEHKRTGKLVYHKLGSRSYLKRSEILASLEQQHRATKPGKGTLAHTTATASRGGRRRAPASPAA